MYHKVRGRWDLNSLRPGGGCTHVLVTSESGDWASVGQEFEVGLPTHDEACDQLRLHFPGLLPEPAAEILEVSGRLPQTIELAAALIKGTGVPVEEAIGRYRDAMSTHVAGPESGYPEEAHTTWSMSMESLRAAYPVAEKFLRLMAHMSPSGVSMDVLRCRAALEWLTPPDGARSPPRPQGWPSTRSTSVRWPVSTRAAGGWSATRWG